jgi:hypothetical protein
MKKYLLALTLFLFYFSSKAQTMKNTKELEDRVALKELVDNFSILADKKDVQAQVQLFTANAMADTYVNGNQVAKLNGRKEMADAFGALSKKL